MPLARFICREESRLRAASCCRRVSWLWAFHSTRQGCWYLGPMTTKEAFEPTFASELLEDCFIDHNKLFGLINIASWSLVFRNPVVN